MQLRLECPICESQFDVAGEFSPTLSICPECNRQFKTSSAIVKTDEKPKREKLILPEQVLAPPALPTHVIQQDAQKPAELRSANFNATVNDVPVQPLKRSFAKRPSKVIPLAIIGGLFAVAAGLLIYLPYVINRPNAQTENAAAQDFTQPIVHGDPSGTEFDKNDAKWNAKKAAAERVVSRFNNQSTEFDPANLDSSKLDPPPPKRIPKRAPERNADFFSTTQLDDCWRENHLRIVRLKIANNMGEKLALGTIVDSRGWMLTSYRAVAGATQIRLTQSASSFEQFKNGEPLSDFVRGVLAVDIENDLVILAINRRFVVNFSELGIATEDTVQQGDHLAQFGLIDDDTPLIIRETQIEKRSTIAELADDDAQFFKDTALSSESLQLIAHSNTQGTVAGAPLLTIEGQLVAMCTEQPKSGASYAIPVALVNNLLKSIETDEKTNGGKNPRELATLNENLTEIGKTNLTPTISVDVNNPYRELSVKLNQIGQECSSFGWIPKTQGDYQTLQKFSVQLIELNNTIYEIPDDPDHPDAITNLANRKTLSEQSGRWANELKAKLAPSPLPAYQVNEFNQIAGKSLQAATIDNPGETYFMAYVRVRLGAMDSPKPNAGQDTVTLDVDQSQEVVIVPYDDRFPPMRPDTLWLAIVEINDAGKISFSDPNTDEKHKAHSGVIAMVLGPLE